MKTWKKMMIYMLIILCSLIVFEGCWKKTQESSSIEKSISNEKGSLKERINTSITKGMDYLLSQQGQDGVFFVEFEGNKIPDAGITALSVVALAGMKNKDEKIKFAVQKGAEYLAALQKPDGGIYLSKEAAPPTYITAVAILVLDTVDREKYKDIIKKAQNYLVGIQGKDKNNKLNYGGIGYGSDETANLSTTQFAVEALRKSGYEDDEAFQRAIAFLSRCQNNSETNDMPYAGNDGGFIYNIHSSKAGEITLENDQKGYKSYGTMTYAGIKSYIYSGVDKNDSRVQNALKWIKNNYTVDANPGMDDGRMGLFYYFHTMAKTMAALDMDTLEDSAGIKHDWRKDLAEKIMSLQNEDGSWQNEQARWYENIKTLVTAYSVIALEYCTQ